MMQPRTSMALLLIAPALSACMTDTASERPLAGPVVEAAVFATDDSARLVKASVLIEREFEVARPWFLDGTYLRRWFAEEASIVPEVGGLVEVAWPTYGVRTAGEVVELVPGEHLLMRLDPFAGAGETYVRLSARPSSGGVRVMIEQWPFAGDARGEEVAEAHRRAWFGAMRVLRSALERGLPTTPAPPPTTR